LDYPQNLKKRVNDILRNFVMKNFLYGDERVVLGDQDSFLEKGIIDSTGVLELVAYLEEEFSINTADEEIVPEHFDSLSNLTSYIVGKIIKREA